MKRGDNIMSFFIRIYFEICRPFYDLRLKRLYLKYLVTPILLSTVANVDKSGPKSLSAASTDDG